ncbi:glycosyltransferase [Flavobacterium sp. Fl-318]|uniref:Glycosyltransferase n=2 Tax=Flavobacterium cupriresistens TaxID=2893885 RepID=A0ABU4RC18_9FLAO|nr:glycosyltransferase [Flavobacterium sp. Fl-318]
MSVYKNDNDSFFKEAIESVLQQTYLPSEIILVVDGEVNIGIDSLLLDYEKNKLFNIIRLPKNGGLANALNVGIQSSKYSLIARMDSDDICFSDRFEKQVEHLVKYNLDIVGGQIIEFGKDINDVVSARKVPLEHLEMIDFMKVRSPFSHPTILFQKNVFEKLNGYDIKTFPEDYDFFVRAYLNGFRFGNIDHDVLWFRLGEDRSKAIKRRWGVQYAKNEIKLYKKFLHMDFYNYVDFLKVIFLKIPLRVLPFPIYKYVYFNILRKNS